MRLKKLLSYNMNRRKYQYVLLACLVVYLCYFFGVSDYIHAKSFEDFHYPLDINIRPLVEDIIAGRSPKVPPINFYPYKFISNSGKCNTYERLNLVILVKSAMDHFEHRRTVRETYGQEDYLPNRVIKTLFFLGIDKNKPKSDVQKRIQREMAINKDIIQIDFHDSYFNNTVKTVMAFRWVYEHCSIADHYLFTDDDMFINVRNLLKYLGKEEYIDRRNADVTSNMVPLRNEEDTTIFAGYVFKSAPHRHKSSKWRVSLDEWPWARWPTFVAAGAYVVSNDVMQRLYVGSLFVQHFRFDDIYLAIIALKLGIKPIHCPQFYFYKKKYSKGGYFDVIASHGYSDHDELKRVWYEQNALRGS